MNEIYDNQINETLPKKEWKLSILDLFFLAVFCIGIGWAGSTIFLVKYVDNERSEAFKSMTVALEHEKLALELADKYKFTTEKIGTLLQNRCVKDNIK